MFKDLLPYDYAQKHRVLLVDENSPKVLYVDMPHIAVISELQHLAGLAISFERVDDEAFNQQLTHCYENTAARSETINEDLTDFSDLENLTDSLAQTHDLLSQESDAPITRLINAILAEAIKENASDVHIETFEYKVNIRFRVDGVLRTVLTPERRVSNLIVSRFKIMSKLNIAEKRLPQDGRMSIRVAGRQVDIRISALPTHHGERLVLRLLEKSSQPLNLDTLGLTSKQRRQLEQQLEQPHGVILVTGPTGSGKSTTLYTTLQHINSDFRNILTIEDPVEFDLEGIGQTQVKPKIDLTFAQGLRAILRQDPDVVMIGEIRDNETAQIAIQASLTGHLVLSTLHTNTAIGAVARLIDMGIEPFLLASSLTTLIAQRLVRVLCLECKTPYQPQPRETQLFEDWQLPSDKIHQPNGCEQCKNTGYRGRTAIYEIIPIDEPLRTLIHRNAAVSELQEYANLKKHSLLRHGLAKVADGQTSLDEVLRIAGRQEIQSD